MRKKNLRLEGDLSFLALILLFLVCLIFTGNSKTEQWGINIAMFCSASVSFLVTYFASLTAGLVMNLLILFVYINYILFGVYRTGNAIDVQLYFWLIWIPVTTVAFHFFSSSMKQLQDENVKLQQRVEELTMVDETTGLENLYSFENNCRIYMRIADRYKMSMVLMVWELRYENEVRRLLGKQKFEEQIQFVTNVARKVLRKEDNLFILQDSPYLWGAIMFTTAGGEATAIQRLKNQMDEERKEIEGDKVQLDMRFGTAVYETEKQLPLELLEQAKKRLSYDV